MSPDRVPVPNNSPPYARDYGVPVDSTPGTSTCRNCGEHVSEQFALVMGDNANIVHRCISCGTQSVGAQAGGSADTIL